MVDPARKLAEFFLRAELFLSPFREKWPLTRSLYPRFPFVGQLFDIPSPKVSAGFPAAKSSYGLGNFYRVNRGSKD